MKNEKIIDKAIYKNIKPVESRSGILYGSGKGLPTFCPYLPATATSAYTKAKCLLSFLVP